MMELSAEEKQTITYLLQKERTEVIEYVRKDQVWAIESYAKLTLLIVKLEAS